MNTSFACLCRFTRNGWLRTLIPVLSAIVLASLPSPVRADAGKSTTAVSCAEVERGEGGEFKTATIPSPSEKMQAYAAIELHRDAEDRNGESCSVTYHLFINDGSGPAREVKSVSLKTGKSVGVSVVGFSKDESKLAGDFWTADGERIEHSPVIYDVASRRVFIRKLENQILGQLKPCDYFQDFTGATNSGGAIIHIPKSAYADKGCSDQKDWVFDLETGQARRRNKNEF